MNQLTKAAKTLAAKYCPSGCDTSKLLSDDLKNKLYYDGF